MKKLLLVVLAVLGGAFVKKKLDAGKNEHDLWKQATDPVDKA